MANLFIAFAAIVISTGVFGLFGLVRMAGLCSRDEDFERVAARSATLTADNEHTERTTLAFSPAA